MSDCAACDGRGWYWAQDEPGGDYLQTQCEICIGTGVIEPEEIW